MDMLDYCKTYNMVKSSYGNQESTDLTSQENVCPASPQKNHENNVEETAVESVQSLSTKPGDWSLYRSATQVNKDLNEPNEKKLSPLKDVARSKGMISTLNTRTHQRASFECELTFAPKLNAMSIKLAKERGERIRTGSEKRVASSTDEFTFKPKVSSNSVKIMQQLKTTFMDRQQMHVEKQKRYIEATINNLNQSKGKFSPVPAVYRSPSRMKKIPKIKEPTNKSSEGPESVTSPEVLESTSAPDLTMSASNKPSNILKNFSSSCDLKSPLHDQLTEKNNLKSSSSNELIKNKSNLKVSENAVNRAKAAYQKMQETSPYNQSVENLYLKRARRVLKARKRTVTHPPSKAGTEEGNEMNLNDTSRVEGNPSKQKNTHSRSHSQPSSHPVGKLKYDDPLFSKVRNCKKAAETAIKQKKVFICHGPYPIVRAVLRKRGWVEKHYKGNLLPPKDKKNESDGSDDDSCDSGDDSDNENSDSHSPRNKEKNTKTSCNLAVSKSQRGSKTRTINVSKSKDDDDEGDGSGSDDSDNDSDDSNEDWNAGYEGNGPDCEFSLMSRSVRNAVASFIWTTKRDDVDFKFLRKDQIVNHYCKAGSFTTKVGLTTNIRNLCWYEEANHFSFFPRSHLLGSDDERMEFIDDYRLTAAISILKWVTERYENGNHGDKLHQKDPSDPPKTPSSTHRNVSTPRRSATPKKPSTPSAPTRCSSRESSSNVIPVKALTLALEACRDFLRCREHLDIDDPVNKAPALTEDSWKQLVDFYYQIKCHGAVIATAYPFLKECQNTLKQMRDHLPQLDIDGVKNIWIVKPGAKSRGRGIMCMDRLDDIVKLVGSNAVGKKEGHFVVQKYIEKPLLIYNVKFDIRQWFLVTDWNPLTLWFYKDCYIRFCSQNFSLEDFHISIHLANNSIQKHFENSGIRDKRIPEDNMWSSDDLKAYLKKRGVGEMWEDVIYPGMKKAVISAVQSCQEIVEYRKNSFELYGADFIISEDYKPWLLEINCSPTMGPSTAVTRKLCAQVLEDTMKVVLDRREDKNCETGRYELAFKQPQVTAPPYIGMSMAVEGQGLRKPPEKSRRHSDVTSPRTATVSKHKETTTEPSTSKPTIVSQPQQTAPESSSVKITSLSRPKESRIVIASSSGEVLETSNCKKRVDVKNSGNTKKPEGSWAVGCTCPPPQSIPIATTFCTTDDGKLKGLITRSKTHYSGEADVAHGADVQQRSAPKAMKIPTAVLKYSSTDKSMRHRTQLPISIGPDSNGKHF